MHPRASEKFGQCRCCLKEGKHRDMMKEYVTNGAREVYYKMIMECFNLFLSTAPNLTTLICASCMHQVRVASSFRTMVAASEQQLLGHTEDRDMIFVTVPEQADVDVKIEPVDLKQEYDDQLSDDNDNSCNIVLDAEPDPESEEEIKGLSALMSRYGDAPALPERAALYEIYPAFAVALDSFNNKIVTSEDVRKLLEDAEDHSEHLFKTARTRSLHFSEKSSLVINALTLLENSTLIPFKSRHRSGFPCFYCKRTFDVLENLKEHQIKSHSKKELKKLVASYSSEALVIYVDVTDLKCTLCELEIPNLSELKTHLTNKHNKSYFHEYTDRIVPFKLTETNVYECQNCKFTFETFGAIERHMNSHYRNYVCKDCGNGFVTKYRLKVHIKSMHVSGTHTCSECNKIFQTQTKLKSHVATVHRLLRRFKCPQCPERFTEYFQRQKHMVLEHGAAPLRYQCKVCDKSFDRKYTLSRHMKRDHLEERDFQCEICSYKCFTKNELIVHSIKHNGERIFECSVCRKSYARKKTLREHMRIHNNDRRFTCDVCGQAFVQKCSLKGHMKTHHSEYAPLDDKTKSEYVGHQTR